MFLSQFIGSSGERCLILQHLWQRNRPRHLRTSLDGVYSRVRRAEDCAAGSCAGGFSIRRLLDGTSGAQEGLFLDFLGSWSAIAIAIEE
ncbi:hypothetical protein GDO78_003102 [Eleutherodactylus coqui]|uniref:Uncharacterized protein n=1 Tax=Eleutherodactylus coqui TaxID=57060 RepID=A0A8J6EUS7_ELECQ|nr:hypothetical protein GDO78_003102 [Eleutherodactylus coqui]